MKKLIPVTIAIVLGVVLSGPQIIEWTGLVKVAMDSDKANERIVSTLEKHFDWDNFKLTDVSWNEGTRLKNNMEYLYLSMVGRDGKEYSQVIKVGGDYQGPKDIEEKKASEEMDYESVYGLTIDDINPEIIMKQYRAVKKGLSDDLVFRSIGRYGIRANQQTGELTRKFTVNVIERGNSTKINSGSLVTEYYELEFIGFEDGSVEYVD
ncbi:MAG: hypothetical protein LUF87_11425 [Alistipes sp.]|nr:hypothetical protein [Alistipes sp.]